MSGSESCNERRRLARSVIILFEGWPESIPILRSGWGYFVVIFRFFNLGYLISGEFIMKSLFGVSAANGAVESAFI